MVFNQNKISIEGSVRECVSETPLELHVLLGVSRPPIDEQEFAQVDLIPVVFLGSLGKRAWKELRTACPRSIIGCNVLITGHLEIDKDNNLFVKPDNLQILTKGS